MALLTLDVDLPWKRTPPTERCDQVVRTTLRTLTILSFLRRL